MTQATHIGTPSPGLAQAPASGVRAWWHRLSANDLRADLFAGLTVAAISLPQSIAYALVAGVDPRFGLYTAIVFTVIAGLLGSSRHLVNGPTGAVSLVVFSALAFIDPDARFDAFEAMFLLTILVGVVQVGIAVFKLGDLTRYISESVVTGFIVGASFLTIIGQVANALGVKSVGTGQQHVLYRLWLTVTQSAPFNTKAILISVSSIILVIAARRVVKKFKLPQLDMLAVLLLVSAAAWALGWSAHDGGVKSAVPLIESIPASLPTTHVPDIQWHWFLDLSGSAFAIGILGLLEALAIAKAIAHKSGQELDYNRQILAEGIGNVVTGFFRGMPGSGSLSRTAINYQAGAVSKFAGVIAGVVVAALVISLGHLTAYIPKAALAGLLIVAASRLIDVARLRYIFSGSRYDAILLLVTALSAVFVDVELAILIGVTVSVAGYVSRAARLKSRELVVTSEGVVRDRLGADPHDDNIYILDIEGELFFGAAPEWEALLDQAYATLKERSNRYLVLRLKRVRNPDIVSIEVFEKFLQRAHKQGIIVLLAGVRKDMLNALKRVHIERHLPDQFIFPEEESDFSATLKAIRKAFELMHGSEPDEGRGGRTGTYYLV